MVLNGELVAPVVVAAMALVVPVIVGQSPLPTAQVWATSCAVTFVGAACVMWRWPPSHEMKAGLGHSKRKGLLITGARGEHASLINGAFSVAAEEHNGKPVFYKAAGAGKAHPLLPHSCSANVVCIWYSPFNGRNWWVTSAEWKERNIGSVAHAVSLGSGMACPTNHPDSVTLGNLWEVMTDDRYVVQREVAVCGLDHVELSGGRVNLVLVVVGQI
jgi:hypothetical protein